jgi:hypothetical protein
VAAAVLGAALTGPAPGNVGGCGQQPPVADAVDFCNDRRWWECRREQFGGRLTDEEFAACIAPIEGQCAGAAWEGTCQPTQEQADACILLLQRADRVQIPIDELLAEYGDCNLCGRD